MKSVILARDCGHARCWLTRDLSTRLRPASSGPAVAHLVQWLLFHEQVEAGGRFCPEKNVTHEAFRRM